VQGPGLRTSSRVRPTPLPPADRKRRSSAALQNLPELEWRSGSPGLTLNHTRNRPVILLPIRCPHDEILSADLPQGVILSATRLQRYFIRFPRRIAQRRSIGGAQLSATAQDGENLLGACLLSREIYLLAIRREHRGGVLCVVRSGELADQLAVIAIEKKMVVAGSRVLEITDRDSDLGLRQRAGSKESDDRQFHDRDI